MTFDITQIIISIIGLIAAVVSSVLIPYIRSKTTAEKFSQIVFWTNIAVQAAEQIYVGTGMGAKKKMYVQKFLIDKGFNLDAEALDAVIESAVLELKAAIA